MLIDDLLSLARTETNELRLVMTEVMTGEVVEEVYQALAHFGLEVARLSPEIEAILRVMEVFEQRLGSGRTRRGPLHRLGLRIWWAFAHSALLRFGGTAQGAVSTWAWHTLHRRGLALPLLYCFALLGFLAGLTAHLGHPLAGVHCASAFGGAAMARGGVIIVVEVVVPD